MTGVRLRNGMLEAFMKSDNELLLCRRLQLQSTKPNYCAYPNRNANFIAKLNIDIQSFSARHPSLFFRGTIRTHFLHDRFWKRRN